MTDSDDRSPLAATLREFLRLESAGGILLLATAILAMPLANPPLAIVAASCAGRCRRRSLPSRCCT